MSEPPATDPSAVSKPSRSRKRSAKGKPSNPRPKSAPPAQATAPTRALLHARDRDSLIRTAAYFRAQRRNFESGHELEDWLAAESEIEAALVEGRVQV